MTSTLFQTMLDHGLTPPRQLFSGGTIAEAIAHLRQMMLDPPDPDRFEGVFITYESAGLVDRGGVSGDKWKTGRFEEQPKWVISDASVPTQWLSLVAILREVYSTKVGGRGDAHHVLAQKANAAEQVAKEAIDRQIRLGYDAVISKSPVTPEQIRELRGPDRGAEIKRLVAEVLSDVTEQYMKTGTPVPDGLEKLVSSFVPRMVMRS
jgi:hypothetical protein